MGFQTPIPLLRVQPGAVFVYDQWQGSSSLHNVGRSHQQPPVKRYTGLLTPGARKRLIRAINLLIAISLPKKAPYLDRPGEFTFRVNFVTLTLPAPQGNITDSQLKSKCLAPWLRIWCRKTEGMSYVWRAERQKNANLHFHLLTDRYIHWQQIRDSWNEQLNRFHFIKDFQTRHGHFNPNSTDVHSVQRIRNLASYIAKYMSKDTDENQPTPGRCWDCSSNLKLKDRYTIVRDTAVSNQWDRIWQEYGADGWSNEFSQGVRITESTAKEVLPEEWLQGYQAWLESVRAAAR